MSLGRIFGTEEDKVNCSFYYKIGSCRHGDRCSRLHNRPSFSQTILIPHMYQTPLPVPTPDGGLVQPNEQEHFAEFCEEVYDELAKFGQVLELVVCKNLGDHLMGNVYVKYQDEESAEKALNALKGRYYAGRLLHVEYSPVSDFREARCRQFEEEQCDRGGYCNFMHLKQLPKAIQRELARNRDALRRRAAAPRRRDPSPQGDEEPLSREDQDELYLRSHSVERRALISRWNEERELAKTL